jgi:WD40 repeat protein
MKKIALVLTLVTLASVVLLGKEEHLKFHEITRWQLGGDGGWDYLTADTETRRLYIARNNRIMVVDLDTGKLVAEVPETEGAHGVALVSSLGLGFATAGRSGTVTVFDLKTLKKVDEIKAWENPDAILYDKYSSKIFVFNGKSKSVSIIEPKSKRILETLSLKGKPEFAATDENGRVFVNIEDQNKLVSIDSQNNKILEEFSLTPCEEPTGLSINSSHDRLYVGCGNKMAVVFDINTKKVIKTLTAGKGIDATAFDKKLNSAFVSAGEGRLTVISDGNDSNDIQVVQDLETEKGARTLAIDSVKGHILLATAKFGPPQEKSSRPSVLPNSFYIVVLGQ